MEKKNRICAYKGDPVVPGVNKKKNGINFAVEVPGDTEASLVLYRKGAAEPGNRVSFYRGVSHRQDVCDAGNRVETGTI